MRTNPPKRYPTNPTRGVKTAKKAVLDSENPCRVVHPTRPDTTRQDPTAYPHRPFCRVVSGEHGALNPTRVFTMRVGANATPEVACRVCRVGLEVSVYAH